LDK
jgi:hypothetical protein